MNDKIEIIITGNQHFADSINDGAEYTSVDYSGKSYGGGSPCQTEEQIQSAIEYAKKTIRREGDTPFVTDTRIKQTLGAWF